MDIHAAIYLAIAFAYLQSAIHYLRDGDYHCGLRDLFLAVLYASIAFLNWLVP
jgi:hypothetical protein